jgi:hypothetical protein
MADEIVKLGELPTTLIEGICDRLRLFTIAFIRTDVRAHESGLLGSGTLVTVGQTFAILTADHVLQVLPRHGRLGILLERTRAPHTVDTAGCAFVDIARGSSEAEGPDLGAVLLAPSIGGAIAAKKSFYNLDRQRERMLGDRPHIHDGAWVAQGFLEERSTIAVDADGRGATKRFFHFSGIGGPDPPMTNAGFDYFDFPVTDAEARSEPVSWGGMSGGGLWQVPLARQDGEIVLRAPLLSGVVYYQHPTTESTCGIRCHGPTSVYDLAYKVMSGERAP